MAPASSWRGRALGQPTVAADRGPAQGGLGRAADPDGQDVLAGAGLEADALDREVLAGVARVLVGERGPQHVDALVGDRAPVGVVGADGGELALDVTGADAQDGPTAGELVEGEEGLGRHQRVAVGRDEDVGEQAQALGASGDPGQRGHGVVPDGLHPLGRLPGHGHVVAHGHVEEARALAGVDDGAQFGSTGALLPAFGVDAALGLDGQLQADLESAGGDDRGHAGIVPQPSPPVRSGSLTPGSPVRPGSAFRRVQGRGGSPANGWSATLGYQLSRCSAR